jgi:hypothetical protein
MAVEERRRIALHRAAAASWGEEVADTLVDLVAPSGHELATRADIQGILAAMEAMDTRWDERFAAAEQRWDERFVAWEQRWDERFVAWEQRWDERFVAWEQRWDERSASEEQRHEAGLAGLEHRLTTAFERGIREAVTTQTMTLVISQLVAVVVIAGLAFGLR